MNPWYIFIIVIILGWYFSASIKKQSKNDLNKKEEIKKLLRQTSRWSTAAKQDKNSMIAVLHANYGAGYLWALKDIYSETDIEKYGNINLKKFEEQVTKIQDFATKRMAKLCPRYAPEPSILTKVAGEG